MATLREVMDRVLLATGERPYVELTASVQEKVRSCVYTALSEVSLVHNWPWLAVQRPADSWSQNAATVNGISELLRVAYIDNVQKFTKVIFEIPFGDMNIEPPDELGLPTHYSRFSDNIFYFDVIPQEVNNVNFFYSAYIPIPSTDTSQISFIPDRLIDLVLYKARANFALQHLDDADMSRRCLEDFGIFLKMATAVSGRLQNQNISMFRQNGSTRYPN